VHVWADVHVRAGEPFTDRERVQGRQAREHPVPTALVIDRLGTYLLLFRDAPDGARYMRLRKQGGSPTQATEDKEFRMSED
jgi:hypothetical protein